MEEKKIKKTIEGVVKSTKMMGTVKVSVERPVSHPKYMKRLVRERVFLAHTDMELNEGDKVVIMQVRPYSKNVKYVVVGKK